MKTMQQGWILIAVSWLVACGSALEGPAATTPGAVVSASPEEAARPVDEAAVARAATGAGDEEGISRGLVPLSMTTPFRGPADAPVTIVEFADFECPFCVRADQTMRALLERYPTQVRIVWMDYPLGFHAHARDAAKAAREAYRAGGNEGFWRMHAALMEHLDALEREDIVSYAQQLGMGAGFAAAFDSAAHEEGIRADENRGRLLGVTGTPAFFINGRSIVGARPIEDFVEIIDDEIARSARLVQAGVASRDVYAAFMRYAVEEVTDEEEDEGPPPARQEPDPAAVYNVPVGNSPTRGPANALVTIVEFSDFQCPFCRRVQPTMERIASTYGADVRFVWKNNPLPFHLNAEPAAELAMAAHAHGKFWQAHDRLFHDQEALERADLEAHARALGLNVRSAMNAIDTHEYQANIAEDQALATRLGARGTPAFFINGRLVVGARPYESFVVVIEEELARARALVASGTPRERVYEVATGNGANSPQMIEVAPRPTAAPRDENAVRTISVPAGAPRRGAAQGRVVIQLFSDFQCPFCGRVAPTVTQFMNEYSDSVTLIWRNYPLPFHQRAMPTAEAAMEVLAQGGNDKFWAFHDRVMQDQQHLEDSDLEAHARAIGGINMQRFRRALAQHTHRAAIEADMEAGRGLDIGTPTFFVNGRELGGAQPIEVFRAAIARALAETPAP